MLRILRTSLLLLCAILMLGCGSTEIRESRVLQAVQEDGEIAYYRLLIEGDANLAKTNYRAGLYDAEALDTLLSGVSESDQSAVDQVLERRRREAVASISARYYQALENKDDTEVQELQRRLATAMQSPFLLAQSGGDAGVAAPGRKYAIIFSALASVVEEAIANIAEEQETEDLVLAAVAGIQRDKLLDVTVEAEAIDAALARLHAVRQAADSLTAPSTVNTAYLESVRRLLQDAAAVRVP